MDLQAYSDKLSLDLMAEPQKQAKAKAAVASLSAGISELSALGYRLAVVEEFGTHEAPTPDEFPKMLYRKGEYPTEVTVEDEVAEAEARAKGYAGMNEVPKPKVEAPAPAPQVAKPAPGPAPAPQPIA